MMPTIMLQKARQRAERQIGKRFVKIIDSVKNFLASDPEMKAYKKLGVTYYS